MNWTTLQHDRILPFEAEVYYRRFSEEQARQIWDTSIWATGLLPSMEECESLVSRYGDDLWELASMRDGSGNVARMIGASWMGGLVCTTYGEFCSALVATAIQEATHFLAHAKGWAKEGDDVS